MLRHGDPIILSTRSLWDRVRVISFSCSVGRLGIIAIHSDSISSQSVVFEHFRSMGTSNKVGRSRRIMAMEMKCVVVWNENQSYDETRYIDVVLGRKKVIETKESACTHKKRTKHE